MVTLRSIISNLLLACLWVIIGLVANFYLISKIFTPDHIKSYLAADNGYEQAVILIKESVLNNTDDGSLSPQVSEFFNVQVNPSFIQQKTEYAIDQYFLWLKGNDTIGNIPLSELNQKAASSLGIKSSNFEELSRQAGGGQIFHDVKLPMPGEQYKPALRILYKLIFEYFNYLLLSVLLLIIFMLFLRFNFKDRALYVVWTLFWPTLTVTLSVGIFFALSKVITNDNLISTGMVSQGLSRFLSSKMSRMITELYQLQLYALAVMSALLLVAILLYFVARKIAKPVSNLKTEFVKN